MVCVVGRSWEDFQLLISLRNGFTISQLSNLLSYPVLPLYSVIPLLSICAERSCLLHPCCCVFGAATLASFWEFSLVCFIIIRFLSLDAQHFLSLWCLIAILFEFSGLAYSLVYTFANLEAWALDNWFHVHCCSYLFYVIFINKMETCFLLRKAFLR